MKDVANGWSISSYGSSPYHFEHANLKIDDLGLKSEKARDCLFVVETINGTLPDINDPDSCHLNTYFEFGLNNAIGLAAYITIHSLEVAEEVIAIRLATDKEGDIFMSVFEYYQDNFHPEAISDTDFAERLSINTVGYNERKKNM